MHFFKSAALTIALSLALIDARAVNANRGASGLKVRDINKLGTSGNLRVRAKDDLKEGTKIYMELIWDKDGKSADLTKFRVVDPDKSGAAPVDDSEKAPADDSKKAPADDSEDAPADDSEKTPADDSDYGPKDSGDSSD